ncbi:hypothetical protein [Microbacterium sp. NPDC096154]|uniref:hypothetical protein n=1 Tax=Microbacterium sp. NPDC096154 TaxID=3155549 RepID=UPI00331A7490
MSRRWVQEDYPSKLWLSESEAMEVLSGGPKPRWFHPWAEHARVAPRRAPHPWGYIHIHGEWGSAPVWELVGYWSREDLAWGLESLFRPLHGHGSHEWYVRDVSGWLNDHECHGVFYWLPTDPRVLRLPLGVTR